jgi:hypothetical protein
MICKKNKRYDGNDPRETIWQETVTGATQHASSTIKSTVRTSAIEEEHRQQHNHQHDSQCLRPCFIIQVQVIKVHTTHPIHSRYTHNTLHIIMLYNIIIIKRFGCVSFIGFCLSSFGDGHINLIPMVSSNGSTGVMFRAITKGVSIDGCGMGGVATSLVKRGTWTAGTDIPQMVLTYGNATLLLHHNTRFVIFQICLCHYHHRKNHPTKNLHMYSLGCSFSS